MRPAVVGDAVVRLVGQQVDRPRRRLQHRGQALQLVGRQHAAARVVRRVDDDRPGARGDRAPDGVDRQLELRRLEVDAHRLGGVGEDHRHIEEPRRREVDDLVAWIQHRAQRGGEAAERAGGHRYILGIDVDADVLAQRVDRDLDRLGVAELVGEPVLVLGRGPFRERLLDLGQRHLLRIAELEVAAAGLRSGAAGLGVADELEHGLEIVDHRAHCRGIGAHANSPSSPAAVRPVVRDETAM